MGEPGTTTIALGLAMLSFVTKIVGTGVLILFGSTAFAWNQYLKETESPPVILAFIGRAIGGMFTGVLVGLMAVFTVDNDALAFISAGLGTCIGLDRVTTAGRALFDKLTKRLTNHG